MIFSLSLSAPLSAPASWGLGGAVFCGSALSARRAVPRRPETAEARAVSAEVRGARRAAGARRPSHAVRGGIRLRPPALASPLLWPCFARASRAAWRLGTAYG